MMNSRIVAELLRLDQDKLVHSVVENTHMMVWDVEPMAKLRHFATAFFGYYLQGRDDYARYFSQDFVSKFDDLAWGIYKGERYGIGVLPVPSVSSMLSMYYKLKE